MGTSEADHDVAALRTNWVWAGRCLIVVALACAGIAVGASIVVVAVLQNAETLPGTGELAVCWPAIEHQRVIALATVWISIAMLLPALIGLWITVAGARVRSFVGVLLVVVTCVVGPLQHWFVAWGTSDRLLEIAQDTADQFDWASARGGPVWDDEFLVDDLSEWQGRDVLRALSPDLAKRTRQANAQVRVWIRESGVRIRMGGRVYRYAVDVLVRTPSGAFWLYGSGKGAYGRLYRASSTPGCGERGAPPAHGWLMHLVSPGYPSAVVLLMVLAMLFRILHAMAQQVGAMRVTRVTRIAPWLAFAGAGLLLVAGLFTATGIQLAAAGIAVWMWLLCAVVSLLMAWWLRPMTRRLPAMAAARTLAP